MESLILGDARGDARLGRVGVDHVEAGAEDLQQCIFSVEDTPVKNPPLQFRYRPCWRCTVDEKGLAEE